MFLNSMSVPPYTLSNMFPPYAYLFHLYTCYSRLTYSFIFNYIMFMSIRYLKTFKGFIFIIVSAGFDSPLIYLTFIILYRLQAQRRYIISIIKCFFYIVPSLIRYLYKDFKLVQIIKGSSIPSILLIIDFINVLILKPYIILYNSDVNILFITCLYLIDD